MDYKNNSISLIRLMAAFSVMYFHVVGHLNADMPVWFSKPIEYVWGVPIFFGISGFLTWKSVEKCQSFTEFAKKRILRIYPELWVALGAEFLAIALTCQEFCGGGVERRYAADTICCYAGNNFSILDA